MRKLVLLTVLVALVFGVVAALPVAAQEVSSSSCAGSLPPRLVVGDQGRIAQRFSTLRETPAGKPIKVIYAPARFVVLQGPICDGFGPLTWYEIQYETGEKGWASESQVYSLFGLNQYWLELDVQQES
jgi:hypothetical protein